MNVSASFNNLLPEVLEQKLYDHLLGCVRTEEPTQVLQRFQQLFIQHGTYPEPGIRLALDALVRSNNAKQSFLPFFNRCCFILVNRWQTYSERDAVVQLVDMLQQHRGPSVISGQPTPSGRLRFMVQEYVRSALFNRLRQLADFLNPQNIVRDEQKPLSKLLYRYPYLYTHCMTSQEDESDYQKMIGSAQKSAQSQFERDLTNYLSHSLIQTNSGASQGVFQNPTLLSHQDVSSTLKTYLTKTDKRGTYKELAQQFWSPAYHPNSYGAFKSSMHEYLIGSVPPKFGRCRFNDQLKGYIMNLYPENNSTPVNDFLVVRTCNQVLNYMVIESRQRPAHTVFMDLLNNLGSTVTIGLMLKVVLLCGKVKPYLDRRFSLLFQHYESQSCSSVRWLVKCLEKLNLAWCAHFGSQNLSYINLL